MLRAIQDFFDQHLQLSNEDSDSATASVEHKLQLATAALLIETSRADFKTKAEEAQTITANLVKFFDLRADEIDELIALAEQEATENVSLHQFTKLINDHYSIDDRIRVVEMMWQVSYADGEKDAHEDHLIRKVAGLLYVPHSEFIAAKLRAQNRQG